MSYVCDVEAVPERKEYEEVTETMMEIHKCDYCGFHIGFDISYLEQVEEIVMECSSCQEVIYTYDE